MTKMARRKPSIGARLAVRRAVLGPEEQPVASELADLPASLPDLDDRLPVVVDRLAVRRVQPGEVVADRGPGLELRSRLDPEETPAHFLKIRDQLKAPHVVDRLMKIGIPEQVGIGTRRRLRVHYRERRADRWVPDRAVRASTGRRWGGSRSRRRRGARGGLRRR